MPQRPQRRVLAPRASTISHAFNGRDVVVLPFGALDG